MILPQELVEVVKCRAAIEQDGPELGLLPCLGAV